LVTFFKFDRKLTGDQKTARRYREKQTPDREKRARIVQRRSSAPPYDPKKADK
jgi:hypothetical protein